MRDVARMPGRLVTEMMETRSLQELATIVEHEISRYQLKKEEYSERLGNFLRDSEEKHGSEEWFKRISLGEKIPKDRGKPKKKEKKKGGKKKKKGKKGEEPEEWIPFQSMLISSSIQGEAEIMFEAIEAITTKIEELEEAKTSLEELRNVGLGDEVSYMMLIREGVPKKIVIKPAGADDVLKFTFSKGFTVVRAIQQ